MTLRTQDETLGDLRLGWLACGLYVLGRGLIIPVGSPREGDELIDALQARDVLDR